MKSGAKKKSGEGARWEGRDPESISMLNGDYEDSSLVLHHHEQVLGYEEQDRELELELELDEEEEEEEEEGEEEEEEEEEKSKLDEGFYEIEVVRRKRIRKGQFQYLIKWRGWPETANTWEPLENLQSCSDVIDAFEECLRSGKHSRKRKRKSSVSIPQPKKKQLQQHSAIVSYNGTGVESDETLPSASLSRYTLADPHVPPQFVSSSQARDINGDVVTLGATKLYNVNRGASNEYDPKLSELKGSHTTNEVTEDKWAIQFSRFTNADCVDQSQSNRRTGARRRKPSSVKRFKQDLASYATGVTIDSGGSFEQLQSEKRTIAGEFSNHKTTSDIIQIIQPISFSASIANNVRDVSVMFKALRPSDIKSLGNSFNCLFALCRSDGKEVTVDNKFLKLTNPTLLIDFYEQHLKYSPTS